MRQDPNHEFVESLFQQVTEAYCQGSKALAFWGLNPQCVSLVNRLLSAGLPPYSLLGIVDERSELIGTKVHGISVSSADEIAEIGFDTLVFTADAEKEEALAKFASADSRTPRIIMAGIRHLEFRNPLFEELMLSCLVKSYATGYDRSLIHLFQAIEYLGAKGLKGDVAEFGICKGGTVVFLKKALDHFGLGGATVFGFDIFDGFPKRKSPLDLYRHHKCEFRDHETVTNYCNRFGIDVVKGDICDTFSILEGRPLILTFFDTDNYSPAKAALPLCAEQTVPGGVIAFDHYTTVSDYIYTIGERIAANEVLTPDKFFNPYGTGLFIKL